jgi:ABC-type nitrate/sulfonate/bicarbonate transport system substrate-binding protein
LRQADRVIRLGTFTPSVLLRVARQTGRLAEPVEEVPVASSPAQFAALADGSVDAGLTSPDNVLGHRGRVDVRVLAAIDRGMGLGLYSRLPAGQLPGARFGVDVPTSGFAFAMYAILDDLGITERNLVTLGSTPKRLRALLAGECDATMLNAGNELVAAAAGLALVGAAPQPYLGTVLVARSDQPGLAGALVATADAVLAGEHHDVVVSAAMDALQLSPDLAGRYLERLLSPTDGLVAGGEVDPAAMATVERLRRTYGR